MVYGVPWTISEECVYSYAEYKEADCAKPRNIDAVQKTRPCFRVLHRRRCPIYGQQPRRPAIWPRQDENLLQRGTRLFVFKSAPTCSGRKVCLYRKRGCCFYTPDARTSRCAKPSPRRCGTAANTPCYKRPNCEHAFLWSDPHPAVGSCPLVARSMHFDLFIVAHFEVYVLKTFDIDTANVLNVYNRMLMCAENPVSSFFGTLFFSNVACSPVVSNNNRVTVCFPTLHGVQCHAYNTGN